MRAGLVVPDTTPFADLGVNPGGLRDELEQQRRPRPVWPPQRCPGSPHQRAPVSDGVLGERVAGRRHPPDERPVAGFHLPTEGFRPVEGRVGVVAVDRHLNVMCRDRTLRPCSDGHGPAQPLLTARDRGPPVHDQKARCLFGQRGPRRRRARRQRPLRSRTPGRSACPCSDGTCRRGSPST